VPERSSPRETEPPRRPRALYLILGLALVLRTYHLTYPPWDYHNWRQTNTLMVARDFARHGFRVLHPQVAWISRDDPTLPSYFSGEFSIESIFAALLYKIFGESDTLARPVVIAFSLLGIFFLYSLLARRAGRAAAACGAFLYALLPYHIFFGRVFMPDVPALALALGCLDALDRWSSDRRVAKLVLAGCLGALALLQKLTVVILFLPALFMFAAVYGRRAARRWELYGFFALAGVPALLWYWHASALARLSGFIMLPVGMFGTHLGSWLQWSFTGEVLKKLAVEAFSPLGLVVATLGLLGLARGRAAWVFRLWVAAAVALLLMIPDTLRENSYTLLLLLPGGAALGGMALAALAPVLRYRAVLGVLLLLLAGDGIRCALPLYQADRAPYDLGVLLRHLTAPQDFIVTETGGSPNVLYAADRRGWMETRVDLPRLENLARRGARYYASVFAPHAEGRRDLTTGLDRRFERLNADESPWSIYSLGPPPEPVPEIAQGVIQNPYPVNYNQQIEMLGNSVREVLRWPTAFEVTYYWQCLDKIEGDLRVFVHITTPEGRTVFQQDHWPLAGHFPTTRWKVGEIIRERYVIVLPGELPAGRYQLRVGWFDPAHGPRLPIMTPSASDGEARAIVAEIEAHRAPRYRWFDVDY